MIGEFLINRSGNKFLVYKNKQLRNNSFRKRAAKGYLAHMDFLFCVSGELCDKSI